MDLKELSPRKGVAKPATLHLKHPFTGDLLFDGEVPATFEVWGAESEIVKGKVKEIEKRKAAGEEISQEQSGAEILSTAIAGWSSAIGLGSSEPFPYSHDNALKICWDENSEWISEQIVPFSRNRRNYLGNLSDD